jgi:hypothetical protein
MAQLKAAYSTPLDNTDTDENCSEDSPFLQSNSLRNRGWLRSPLFFLLDVLLVLALFYFAFQYHGQLHCLDCQGDTTGYAPAFSSQIIIFRKHPEFISNHTSLASLREAREHWKTLVPRMYSLGPTILSKSNVFSPIKTAGQGFIEIDNHTAEQYNFPKLIKIPEEAKMPGRGKGGYTLGTSVVHSLHCLVRFYMAPRPKPALSDYRIVDDNGRI